MQTLRYTLNRHLFINSGVTQTAYINIPVAIDFDTMDNNEEISQTFIPAAVEDVINRPIDAEKARFNPIYKDQSGTIFNVSKVIYKITFPAGVNYGNIGFNNDDVYYLKNNIKNSFLRIAFYNSDITTNQNFEDELFTLYSNISDTTIPANQLPVQYSLTKQIEGYSVYYYKTNVLLGNSISLYAPSVFNNAKTGKVTKLCTTSGYLDITNFASYIHLKYNLTHTNDGCFYEIDPSCSNNISFNNTTNELTVNLYEMVVH